MGLFRTRNTQDNFTPPVTVDHTSIIESRRAEVQNWIRTQLDSIKASTESNLDFKVKAVVDNDIFIQKKYAEIQKVLRLIADRNTAIEIRNVYRHTIPVKLETNGLIEDIVTLNKRDSEAISQYYGSISIIISDIKRRIEKIEHPSRIFSARQMHHSNEVISAYFRMKWSNSFES